MSNRRRENMAKRIQTELDDKGEGEEVDPDTIDWLTDTYKTKSQVAREQREAAERGLNKDVPDADVRTCHFIIDFSEDFFCITQFHIPYVTLWHSFAWIV